MIGVVDIAKVLDESKLGMRLSKKLEASAMRWQQRGEELKKKHEQASAALQKAAPQDPNRQRFKRDLQLLEMQLRTSQEQMRYDLETQREEFRATLLQQTKPIIDELSKTKNFSLVLTVPNPMVAYVSDENNITHTVLERLDNTTSD